MSVFIIALSHDLPESMIIIECHKCNTQWFPERPTMTEVGFWWVMLEVGVALRAAVQAQTHRRMYLQEVTWYVTPKMKVKNTFSTKIFKFATLNAKRRLLWLQHCWDIWVFFYWFSTCVLQHSQYIYDFVHYLIYFVPSLDLIHFSFFLKAIKINCTWYEKSQVEDWSLNR